MPVSPDLVVVDRWARAPGDAEGVRDRLDNLGTVPVEVEVTTGEYAQRELARGVVGPRLRVVKRGRGIGVADEDGHRTGQRRPGPAAVRLDRPQVRADRRQQHL